MDPADLHQHISRRYNEELERVSSRVLSMGGLVEQQLQRALKALLEGQNIADALNALSERTGVPVVYPYDLTRNRRSNPVTGRFTVAEALEVLLAGPASPVVVRRKAC